MSSIVPIWTTIARRTPTVEAFAGVATVSCIGSLDTFIDIGSRTFLAPPRQGQRDDRGTRFP